MSFFREIINNLEDLIKDKYGLLYSTELLLSIIMLVFIIGIMANLSDDLNEKILSEEELSSLENIAVESCDYLLNNPGNPENWEEDEGLDNGDVPNNIIAGLAIKGKKVDNGEFYDESSADKMIMSNTISYMKLIKIKNNYDELIDRNLFNESFKSSMAIYPLNSEIGPLLIGDDIDDNVTDNDIAVVNRTVKCDYYSNFVVYNFNDFELFGEDVSDDTCNHDTNPNLTDHANDERSLWLCKSFRVYKKSLDDYNYYLISDESVKNGNVYWILESLNRTNDNKQRLNQELIDLNPYLMEDLSNSSDKIYFIHFNLEKNNIDDFRTVLVAIPKNMTENLMANDELKYDYFRPQEVNYVLKIENK